MLSSQVHAAVKPLRFIFWGGILWFFDITFSFASNGTGFRFDILDDTLGTSFIAWGVFRLAGAAVPGKYAMVMRFIKGVAVASIIETAIKHFVFEEPPPLVFLLTLLGVCQLAAIVLFCLAMKWFCLDASLPRVAKSWRVTLLLFSIFYVLPVGLLSLPALVGGTATNSINMNLGPAALLLFPLFIVPLVHLFISTSRMRLAAQYGVAENATTGGFPVILIEPSSVPDLHHDREPRQPE